MAINTESENPRNVRKIGDGSSDLAVKFENGGSLRIYGLSASDKLVVREATETKREKSIYGPDVVTVHITSAGSREIVDWPLSDENARSEGLWSWIERLICHPEVKATPLEEGEDPYAGTGLESK